MYSAVTRDIRVIVRPTFLADRSDADEGRWFWRYDVRIENRGEATVQLRSRYWRITDANGTVQEVRGPGVVGQNPVLRPGEAFEYNSGTPLGTPSGFMVGTYEMQSESGERFDVEIPAFSLDAPGARSLN